jgi:uncharacterized protein YfaS (alpha-2-macroglobulin family)
VPYLGVHPSDELRNQEVSVDVYQYKSADKLIAGLKELTDIDQNWMNTINKTVKIDNELKKVANFKAKFQIMQNSWMHYLVFPEALTEGYYLINVSYGKNNYQTHVQVNNAAVYIMLGVNESLAWINDTVNGNPIAGAKLVAENGKTATSNSEGIAIINAQVVKPEEFNQQYFKVELNNRPTYVAQLLQTFYAYDFYGHQVTNPDYWSYLYLDRDLYQQTDSVNLWGLVKPRTNETKTGTLTATLYKSTYMGEKTKVMSQVFAVDQFGTFDEKFVFTGLVPGSYYIELQNDDVAITQKSFEIRNYKKPAYQVDASFNKKSIYAWDTATLNLQANFFEGSPVSGLKLKTNYYEESNNKDVGQVITDKNGMAQIKYTPKISTAQWMPINVSFFVANDQAEDQNIWQYADILVFPKNVMLNIDIKDRGKTADITVATNMIDLTKQAAQQTAYDYVDNYKGANVDRSLDIKIMEIEYKREVTGSYYDFINKKVVETYQYNRVERQVDNFTANTVAGEYKFNYQFSSDFDYEIVVSTTDTRGNSVVHSGYLSRLKYVFEDSNEIYYTIEEVNRDKYNYRVNEPINLQLMKNGVEAIDTTGDRLLMIKLKDGLRGYTISDTVQNSYRFTREDIPNSYYEAVYFDGKRVHLAGMRANLYDYTEKELEVTMVADKANYRPGDTARLTFMVKNKNGSPVSARLNVSIVDEALFALRDQAVRTAESVYSYVVTTGKITNYVSEQSNDMRGGAEKGSGDGYAEYIRSDFKDTAEFRTVTTDASGRATLTFQIPDNLTAWRVTYQAITTDLYAGNGKSAVNAELPFFALVIANERYLVGDSISISTRSYGTATNPSGTVEYLVTLTDGQGKETKFTASGKANDYTTLALGKLPIGEYTLQVEAKQAGLSDGIKKTFTVEETLLKANIVNYYDLANGLKITDTTGYTNLRFYSKNNSLYYNALTGLAYNSGSRVDQILARKLGSELLNERFSENNIVSGDFQLSQYQLNDGGIALLPYSESDAVFSAKVAATASELFDRAALTAYFKNILADKNSSGVDQAAAYWGLAALNEPVLLEVQNAAKAKDLSVKEKVLYAVALAEFGDFSSAEQMYINILNNYGKRVGQQVYVGTGLDKDDVLEATSLLAIVATKVDSAERYRMLDYIVNNQTDKILTLLEQLIFIQNDIPKVAEASSFAYALDGKKETVTIKGAEQFSMILSAADLAKLSFTDVKGDLTVAASYYGKLEDAAYKTSDTYSVKRSYQVGNAVASEIKLSDVVNITLTPSFSANAPDGYYEITDCLPAGFRYIENTEPQTYGEATPIYYDSERVVFGYYYSKDKKIVPLTYKARVASTGEYVADKAVIQHFASGSLNFTAQERTIIK